MVIAANIAGIIFYKRVQLWIHKGLQYASNITFNRRFFAYTRQKMLDFLGAYTMLLKGEVASAPLIKVVHSFAQRSERLWGKQKMRPPASAIV